MPCAISLPSHTPPDNDASTDDDDACVEECLRGCVVRSVDSVYEGTYSMKGDEGCYARIPPTFLLHYHHQKPNCTPPHVK